jgi:hypothetical protein
MRQFRNVFFTSILTLATCAAWNGAGYGGGSKDAHHDLTVTLQPEAHLLSGLDRITLSSVHSLLLTFALNPEATILSVELSNSPENGRGPSPVSQAEGAESSHHSPYRFADGQLQIQVPESFMNKEITLAIAYKAHFNDPVPQNPANFEDPTYGVTGVIASTGVFLLPEAGWYPQLEDSSPTILLRVHTPPGMEAISAGALQERQATPEAISSTWKIDHAGGGISLSAASYVIKERKAANLPLYAYFFPESESLAETYLSATADYIALYSGLYGPYPFSKFAVVENFFPTGYGFPSYTLLGSSVIRLPFIVKTSLGHEVAHSWFGNCLLVDYSRGNWSEGLTTYVADHFLKERVSEKEAREYRQQILRDYALLVPPQKDFPLAQFGGRIDPATRSVGYGKGAMLFHMIRRITGDEAFRNGLRALVEEKRFQRVSWNDFAMAFAKSSGKDFDSFMRQWVERPGAPVLALHSVESEKGPSGWIVRGILAQKEPAYTLRVPVRIETDAEPLDTTLAMDGKELVFELHSAAAPKRLVVDPETDLFRRLDPEEIPPIVNTMRGTTSPLAVTAKGISPPIVQAFRTLLAALGLEDVPILPENELTDERLRQNDLIFLGVPENRKLLPLLPEGLALEKERFTLAGKSYDSAGDALFAVLSSRSPDRGACAVFLPLSREAGAEAARKVGHYGKYSALAFTDGVNKEKMVWTTSGSKLVHTF